MIEQIIQSIHTAMEENELAKIKYEDKEDIMFSGSNCKALKHNARNTFVEPLEKLQERCSRTMFCNLSMLDLLHMAFLTLKKAEVT